ncbi:hypothetical protein HYALB_00009830 [Hymenoscyphus albidus]|uniref:Uncharacterized protein n=1 Tax=Hymenoscyphus albidus TaxID=595503 RepID=A0A9N9PZ93_9HELO|nr:hypothetical protein HYALB_00009830 [Hymenoscyphus albidus]
MVYVYVNSRIVQRRSEEERDNRLKRLPVVRNRGKTALCACTLPLVQNLISRAAFENYKNDYPKTRFNNFEELKDWRKDIAEKYLDNALWQWKKASWYLRSKTYQERAYEIYKEEHPKTIYKGNDDISSAVAWRYIDKVVAEEFKRNKEYNKRRKEKICEKGPLRVFFYRVTHLPKESTM